MSSNITGDVVAYVYVLGDDTSTHKIGLSISPRDRCNAVAALLKRPLTVRYNIGFTSRQDAMEVERLAHYLLKDKRFFDLSSNELFSVSEAEAVSTVENALSAFQRGERAPRTEDMIRLSVIVPEALLRRIDALRAGLHPIPNRSDAVRVLLDMGADLLESQRASIGTVAHD